MTIYAQQIIISVNGYECMVFSTRGIRKEEKNKKIFEEKLYIVPIFGLIVNFILLRFVTSRLINNSTIFYPQNS